MFAHKSDKFIQYKTGEPITVGIYACRVPHERLPGIYTDIFLIWDNSRWEYYGIVREYKNEVCGWIGPLARKIG